MILTANHFGCLTIKTIKEVAFFVTAIAMAFIPIGHTSCPGNQPDKPYADTTNQKAINKLLGHASISTTMQCQAIAKQSRFGQ